MTAEQAPPGIGDPVLPPPPETPPQLTDRGSLILGAGAWVAAVGQRPVPVAVAIALAELGLLGLLAALVARQEPLESGEI